MATYQRLTYWRERYRSRRDAREAAKPVDPIASLSEIDLAYLAGLIDGEGSLTLGFASPGHVLPTLGVIMTHEAVVREVAAWFGTTVKRRAPKDPERHRPTYHARIAGMRAINLCVRLLPYLRVKRPQAELLIEFGQTYTRTAGWAVPLSAEERARRVSLKERMHRLNSPLSYRPNARDDGAELG